MAFISKPTLPPPSSRPRPIHVQRSICLLCAGDVVAGKDARTTSCCFSSICASCSGTKIASYDPCIACGGGMARVPDRAQEPGPFVLGDDEDEDDESRPAQSCQESEPAAPPYDQAESAEPLSVSPVSSEEGELSPGADDDRAPSKGPRTHVLVKGETLIGIALRYGLDPYHLCQTNQLPISTVHTTPHLLFTRRFLYLLPSPPPVLPASVRAEQAHERALLRFGQVTRVSREVDYAKVYVDLAEAGCLEDEDDGGGREGEKKGGPGPATRGVEDKAISRFLSDNAFEQEAGAPMLPGIPLAGPSRWKSSGQEEAQRQGSWWSSGPKRSTTKVG